MSPKSVILRGHSQWLLETESISTEPKEFEKDRRSDKELEQPRQEPVDHPCEEIPGESSHHEAIVPPFDTHYGPCSEKIKIWWSD